MHLLVPMHINLTHALSSTIVLYLTDAVLVWFCYVVYVHISNTTSIRDGCICMLRELL